MGFDQHYWSLNFSDPESMDGIGNAREHAQYLKSLLALDEIEIRSVIDFGFGHGTLLAEIVRTLKPVRAVGVESSAHVLGIAEKQFRKIRKPAIKVSHSTILEWCEENARKKSTFDLGICTSVFQYLSDKELGYVVPILSRKARLLYFTVPTDIELELQEKEHGFTDKYAIHRPRSAYRKFLSPHFNIVSSRLLESRHHFDERNTWFPDLLYHSF